MIEGARARIERLNINDAWEFDHMITAFWHGFGIANGLSIQKDDVEVIHYREGPCGYQVKAEVMQQKLAEYLRWLESYKEHWGIEGYPNTPDVREEIAHPYHKSREPITRMIELLQI